MRDCWFCCAGMAFLCFSFDLMQQIISYSQPRGNDYEAPCCEHCFEHGHASGGGQVEREPQPEHIGEQAAQVGRQPEDGQLQPVPPPEDMRKRGAGGCEQREQQQGGVEECHGRAMCSLSLVVRAAQAAA